MISPFIATAPSGLMMTVMLQLIIILLAARIFGGIAKRLNQPVVVGEIIGGIVLGPSLFQAVAPEVWATIFKPEAVPVFAIIKELGLVLLLFLVGLEFEFSHLRRTGTSSLVISLSGILLPFALGFLLAWFMFQWTPLTANGKQIELLHFMLFMGTAMSITALPILGRIMMELNITRTRLGVTTITAAAVDDACAWIILATVAGIVRAGQSGEAFDYRVTLRIVGLTLSFLAFMLAVSRPLLSKALFWYFQRTKGELGPTGLAVLLSILFLCSIVTEQIGIFAIFGAFILGATLSNETQLREELNRQLKTFVTAFFLPIFFTFTGLRTNIGGLDSCLQVGFCALVLVTAVSGKFGGCYITSRWVGFSPREAGCIAVMMNTRALMELIVVNVGLDLHIITPEVFTMLVLMAIITTIMTTPILLRLYRGTELEPFIDATIFGQKAKPRH